MLLSEMMKTRLARQANVCVEDKLPVIDLAAEDEELQVLLHAGETQVSHVGMVKSEVGRQYGCKVTQFRIVDWLSEN